MPRVVELDEILAAFARGVELADACRPRATNRRSGTLYQEGIGPHSESSTISLAVTAAEHESLAAAAREVPYADASRNRCDLVIGAGFDSWAIEVKMLRLVGDNGKPNDNMLMHILSPYPAHRSAVTDCQKLLRSALHGRKAILIFGYDYDGWAMDPAIRAFELLASADVELRAAATGSFSGLVHPVHTHGRVFGWEVRSPSDGD